MTAQEIIASAQTKTSKMLALFQLGYTRSQVAELLGVGYGFVQNVYARAYGVARPQTLNVQQAQNWTLNRKFGVEIEAYGVCGRALAEKLTREGVNTTWENYNHTTRRHWKIVSDSSIRGNQAFELVSPPLKGQNGIDQIKTVCKVLADMGAKVTELLLRILKNGDAQMRYEMKGGGSIEADGPGDIVRKLRELSMNPEDSIQAFMDVTADACKIQNGSIVNSYDEESFVEDLVANGFLFSSEIIH